MIPFVFAFEAGNAQQNDLLGGKGANLAEMTHLGFPVPRGFTISTEACNAYLSGNAFPDGLEAQVDAAITELESKTKKKFGDQINPLLVSVRSGAKISMPGMMDTVLNLGMNDAAEAGLAKKTNNANLPQIVIVVLSRCFLMLSWASITISLKRLCVR